MRKHIKYNEIDIEIRNLVYLINEFEGIKTLFSCSGHQTGEQGYITFKADSQKALNNLVTHLPKRWNYMGFRKNQPESSYLWINVELMPEWGLVYSIRFEGFPFYVQRELIIETETHINAKP